MVSDIITLLRPKQWVKNTFVFLPMFFSGNLLRWEYWAESFAAFVIFCIAASGIYCLNDVMDSELDRMHPLKRTRPVASGKISKRIALSVMSALLIAAIAATALLFSSNTGTLTTIMLYIALNIAYSIRLKHIALVDVFIIGTGFVFRVLFGGLACHIPLSPWIVILVFLVTTFMALAKRRDDLLLYEKEGKKMRKSITNYSLSFLDQSLGILAATSIVCYILYTVSPDTTSRLGNDYVYTSTIFVIAGILRYLQLTLVAEKSGSPTEILCHDRFIQTCIAGWIILFIILIYL